MANELVAIALGYGPGPSWATRPHDWAKLKGLWHAVTLARGSAEAATPCGLAVDPWSRTVERSWLDLVCPPDSLPPRAPRVCRACVGAVQRAGVSDVVKPPH